MTKEDLKYFEQYPEEKVFIKVGHSYFTEKQLVAAKVYAANSNLELVVLNKVEELESNTEDNVSEVNEPVVNPKGNKKPSKNTK